MFTTAGMTASTAVTVASRRTSEASGVDTVAAWLCGSGMLSRNAMHASKRLAPVDLVPTTELNKLFRRALLRIIGAATRYPLDCAKISGPLQATLAANDVTP